MVQTCVIICTWFVKKKKNFLKYEANMCPYMHLTFVTFKILSLNLSFLLMCSFVYLMHENWVFATSIKVVAKPEMEFGDINRRNICGGRSEGIVVFNQKRIWSLFNYFQILDGLGFVGFFSFYKSFPFTNICIACMVTLKLSIFYIYIIIENCKLPKTLTDRLTFFYCICR